ncbi:MAG TPA: ABC transporter substrate-binding protein [Burkholderiales bacterium]|nr:ABC transporter substrate-binding protein [Burkholderiales bacterium]
MARRDDFCSRRGFIKAGAGLAAGTLFPGLIRPALAAEKYPPLGNFPAGVSGDTVFVGLSIPQTGSYSAEGKDHLRGYQLAIEHINSGALAGKIPELGGKGVLGKQIKYGVVDTETKPEPAIQGQTRFIRNDKAIMISGCYSSATAVALAKLGQREHVIYMAGASGSDDTTGKDCQRYCFRSQPDGYMSAKAMAPALADRVGKNKKAAYLIADYTFGHTVANSMMQFTKPLGWKTVTQQVSPLGTVDFSTYMLNIANSGADVFVNVTAGNDTTVSTKQAKQFGVLDKMRLVVPTMQPFLAQQVGAEVMQGALGVMDFWWTMENMNDVMKFFVEEFEKKYHVKPYWAAHIAYEQMTLWAACVERAKTFYPPQVIKTFESEKPFKSTLGDVYYRAGDHQLIRPVPVVIGKKPSEMHGKDDYFDIAKLVPGKETVPPVSETGCHLGSYT